MKKIFKLTLLVSVLCLTIFSYTFKGFAASNDDGTEIFEISNGLYKPETNLNGQTHTMDLKGGNYTDVRILIKNGTLIIKDSVGGGSIKGRNESAPIIQVDTGAKLILESGTLKGNTNTAVTSNDGGGAIKVMNAATFEMNGGTITENKALNGGGVYVGSNSFFTMNGGFISNNSTNLTTGSTHSSNLLGGGVYIGNAATFTMNGGTIQNNTATVGGGIYLDEDSTLNIANGTIHNNNADLGGGLFFHLTTKDSNINKCNIYNNKAKDGAGIYLEASKVYLNADSKITSNVASQNGGGIYLKQAANLILNGGNISLNEAENGAGVYAGDSYNRFIANNGNITSNTASSLGSGVYVNTNKFSIENNVNICDNVNTDIYLCNRSCLINIEESVFTGKIGITTSIAPSIDTSESSPSYIDIPVIKVHENNGASIDSPAEIYSNSPNYILTYNRELNGNNEYLNYGYLRYCHYHSSIKKQFNTFLTNDNIKEYLDVSSNSYILPGGSYYLLQNIIVDKPILINSSPVEICLNGYLLYNTSTSNSLFIIDNSTKLTIYDCNNKIQHPYLVNSDTNNYIFINNNEEVQSESTITGGIISQKTNEQSLIQIIEGEFILESGKIMGFNSTASLIDTIEGKVTIKGGQIAYNYTSSIIGLINISVDSEFTIDGNAEIVNNLTDGNGTIYLVGTGNFNAGNIKNNKATIGAGVYALENSTVNIGYQVYIYENVDMTGSNHNIYLDKTLIHFTKEQFVGRIGIYSTAGQVTSNFKDFESDKNEGITCDVYNLGFELNSNNEYCLLNKNTIFDFIIENWTYGDTPSTPTANASYGIEHLEFTYTLNLDSTLYGSEVPTNAGEYKIKAYIPASDTYTSAESTITFRILPKVINRPSIASQIYNGTVLEAGIDEENPYYDVISPLEPTIYAGEYFFTLQLKNKTNYIWDTGNALDQKVSFVIEPKVVTVIWDDNNVFTYNGEGQHVSGIINPTDLVTGSGDQCTILEWSGIQVDANTNGVKYYASPSKLSNPNYKVSDDCKKEFKIVQAQTTINLRVQNWTYGDNVTSPITATSNIDEAQIILKYGTVSNYYDMDSLPTNAGTYYVRAMINGNNNYTTYSTFEQFTISPIELLYYVEDVTASFGETFKEINYTLREDKILTKDKDSFEITCSKDGDDSVGSHNIILTSNNPNYKINYNDAKYEITKATSYIYFSNSMWKYGEEPILEVIYNTNFGTPVYKTFVNGNWVNGVPTNAGTYQVKAEILDTPNYSYSSQEAIVTITKRNIILNVENVEEFYGAPEVDLSKKVSQATNSDSILSGDNLNLNFLRKDPSNPNAIVGNDVGEYIIVVEHKNDNYNVTCANTATYTIKKATTNISNFKMESWTFGSISASPTYSSNYFDKVVITYSTDNTVFTTTKPTNAGTYYAKAEITETKNYSGYVRTTTFEIFPKEISVKIEDKRSVYGKALKPLTFIYDNKYETLINQLGIELIKADGLDAGTYKITLSYNGDTNYYINYVPGTYTIEKADNIISAIEIEDWIYGQTPSVPSATPTFGEIEFVYSTSSNPNGTFTDEIPTEAGRYYVMAIVRESKNYKYNSSKEPFDILKATYDTTLFKFENTSVKYDGTAKSILLEGEIPEELIINYANNNQVEPGEYNIIIQFTVDKNHEPIQSMNAKLTILKDELYSSDEVMINSVNGSNPNATVQVVENSDYKLKDYKPFLFKNNRIYKLYDISFIINENSIQPDGDIEFKFLLPELLIDQEFEIINIHNKEGIKLEYEIIDSYIVFTTNQMSEFVIAYKETSLVWLALSLSLIVIGAIGLGLFLGFLTFADINLITYFKEKITKTSNEENYAKQYEQTEDSNENKQEETTSTEEVNEDNSEKETTSSTISLNCSILGLLPVLIILNDSQLKAVIALSVIAGVFLLSSLGIFIYKQFFQPKVRAYYENKRIEEEKRLRPYSYTVYNQDEETDNSNNMEFILHPDFRTRKFDGDVDTDPDDEENVIEEINTYQNGRLVKLSINRSFKARLCQSNDDLQEVYSLIKNQFMFYKGLVSVISWSYDNILLNDIPVAKFTLRGKYLTLYLALDPKKFNDQSYNFKDVSNVKKFETVPMKIRFILDKNIDDALELIDIMCTDLKLDKKDTILEADYSLPYRTTDALIESEDIKVVSVTDEFGNPFVNVVQQPVYTTTQVVNVPVQMKEIYNRSFLSKLIQSDKNIKNAFALIKNRFNSYAGVESKLSWDHDSIYYGDELLGIITIKSKTLYFYIALEPVDYMNTDYVFKDASDDEKYSYTPMMIKVKNTKRVNQSLELIDILAKQYSLEPSNTEPIEYNFPYQTDEELIKDELIQVINLDNDYDDDYDDDVDFESEALYTDDEAAHEYDEMTTLIDGKVYIITFNRSFTAKFIQSSSEVQDIYQTLKNKFLSYPLKSRVSWAYDSFSYLNKNVARFTIKGKSLYLYLAIDPNTIDHNEFNFKDASGIKRYANTPLMIKLKTKKSVEQAKKLIDVLGKNLNLKASSIPEVDYHQHYLSQEDLINAGLIKKIQIETESSKEEDVSLSKFIRSKISVSEAKSEMTDEEAQQQLVDTYVEVSRILTLKKVVINIDTLDLHFDNGDIVDLTSLQQKNLISKNVTHIKILARGELSKKLIVIADQFSLDAVKMISLMGGKALKKNQIVKES